MAYQHNPGFAARLRVLLSGWDDQESIRVAADRIGISHPMLQRALDGRVPNNPDALLKIADVHGVTVEWLLRGQGQSPDLRNRFSANVQWRQIVEQLNLPPNAKRVMEDFPKSTMKLVYDLIVEDEIKLSDGSTMSLGGESPELIEAIRGERRAWVKLFREWIDLAGGVDAGGVDRVRAQIITHLDWFESRTVPIDHTRRPPSESLDR